MKCISIIGNIGANAVRRTTSDGRELMSFNVAVNQGETAIWFNCVGVLRERVFPFLVKGQCVCVIGDLQAKIYKNDLDLSVSIDKIELCGARPKETEAGSSSLQSTAAENFDASKEQTL